MRNLKRALSLTLASVMLLGMMVVGSSALSFNDADGISNVTAATVLEHLGVMQGDGQGNFMPEQSVTRAQMAILICRILYGDKLNVKQFEGVTKYTDVPATEYYTGYINLATQLGIIGGYGDGRFGPDDTVTTAQAALMLSRALGYFKANELEGQDWALAAIAQATKIDMFGDLKLATNDLLARDNVAEMVFNTMTKAVPVMYSERWGVYYTDSQSIVEGVKFNYRNSLAYQNFDLVYNEGQTDDFERPATEWGIGTIKTGNAGIDDKGHIEKNGANIKTSIIKAVNGADETYTAAVKLGDIYKDLGLSDSVNSAKVKFYRNGKDEDTTSGGKLQANDNTDLSALGLAKGLDTKIGGNGVLTQVWYDTDAEKDEVKAVITMIDTYVAEVSNVVKATGSADRYIRLRDTSALANNGSVVNYNTEVNNKFETEAFEADDLVTFTVAWNGAKYDIQTVESLALANTAVLTKWEGSSVVNSDKGRSDSSFTAGETYKYSTNKMIVDEDGRDLISNSGNGIANFTIDESEVNIYLDKYGYAIYVSGVEGETNYAAVIGIGGVNQYGSETRGATLLLPDGTQIEVKAKMANGYSWDDMTVQASGDDAGKNLVTDGLADIVTYSVGTDGVYKLSIAGDARLGDVDTDNGNREIWNYTGQYDASAATDTNKSTTFINGKSLMQLFTKFADGNTTVKDNKTCYPGTVPAQLDYYTTSKTIFFVATPKTDSDGYNYNVYTGYANAPSVDKGDSNVHNYINGVAFVLNKQYPNQIDAIYIDADQMAGVSGVDTYFVFNREEHKILTNSNGKYYTLPAIVNGEEAEILIDAETKADWDKSGSVGGTETLEKASKGVYAIENVVEEKGIITSCSVVNTKTFTAANGTTPITLDGVTTTGRGTVKASGEVIGIGQIKQPATYWAYNSDTNVYSVNKDYTSISVSSIGAIQTDEDDLVFAGHTGSGDNKKLTDVIVVEVEPGVTYSVAASANVQFSKDKSSWVDSLTGLSKSDVVYVKIANGYVLNTDKSTVALTADGKLYKFTVTGDVDADAIVAEKSSSATLDSRVTLQVKVGDEVIDATTVKVLTNADVDTGGAHKDAVTNIAAGDLYFEFPAPEGATLATGATGTMTIGSNEYGASAGTSIAPINGGKAYKGYLIQDGGNNPGLAVINSEDVAEVVLEGTVSAYTVTPEYKPTVGTFVTMQGANTSATLTNDSNNKAALKLSFRNAGYGEDYAEVKVNVTVKGTDSDGDQDITKPITTAGVVDLGGIIASTYATGPVTVTINSVTPTKVRGVVDVSAAPAGLLTVGSAADAVNKSAGLAIDTDDEIDLEATGQTLTLGTGVKSATVKFTLSNATKNNGDAIGELTATIDNTTDPNTLKLASEGKFKATGAGKVTLTITEVTEIKLTAAAFEVGTVASIGGLTGDKIAVATVPITLEKVNGAWKNKDAFSITLTQNSATTGGCTTDNSEKGQISALTGSATAAAKDSTGGTTKGSALSLVFEYAKGEMTFNSFGTAISLNVVKKA